MEGVLGENKRKWLFLLMGVMFLLMLGVFMVVGDPLFNANDPDLYCMNSSGEAKTLCRLNDTLYINMTTVRNQTLFPMGGVYTEDNALVTSIPSSDTWAMVNASWKGNPYSMFFSNSTNGTLTYTGEETMFFHIAATISIKGVGSNDIMRAAVFKNGVLLPGGQVHRKLAGAGDVGSTAIHVAVTLDMGDYLNLYLLNENDGDDMIVTYSNLFAMGMRITA